ncbi:MAG: protein translocase subunit SecD [Bacteroidetes bacterium]|jgi:preprotein translocase subunit SecD|nr:protein translocase subunit SecD [Bacteroidota bacterium]
MQGNGFKIFLTVAFLVLSGYYLFPTFQNIYYNNQLEDLEGEAREDYLEENYGTMRAVKEKALKLGLDLQGGMHVTLEVRVEALLRGLARETDETFEEVLAIARERAATSDVSMIDAFVDAFEERDPDARLSRYYRDEEATITRRSSNDEVQQYLRTEADEAIIRAIEIVRSRVDRYGVTEPSIQRQGTRRIVVELPGVDDPERIRELLKGTARLEFRLMGEPRDLQRSLQQMIQYFEADTAAVADTAAADTLADEALAAADGDTAAADTSFDVGSLLDEEGETAPEETNRLLAAMQPIGQGVVFGAVSEQDTAAVNDILSMPEVQDMVPTGIELLYTAEPVGTTEEGFEVYHLLGVRSEAELTGEVVTDANVSFDQMNRPEVSLSMNSEGGRTWARVTGANIDKNVAIVLDQVVYSYPRIIDRIVGGRTSITGLDSRSEAEDIVTVLKSGALPAPVDIVEERTVGPSLGQASIRAGFTSVIVGLLLVALFMIFYYRTGGIVADMALLINIIFILGILAGFNATLTLPGIAGIVLTIGMAVDANVLIFDRIREEQSTGKTLKASIDGGYAKALSAIIDANITTFFVGVILYSFGVGPIQGFAVTLMAGILASLFSAIVFTRIIFDWMVLERRMNVSYG